jgi:hypothetical protein
MNFHDLINKINDLDKNVQNLNEVKSNSMVVSDMDLNAVRALSGISEGCGDMMPGSSSMNSTPVTMNVSMNASGKESIRDLLSLISDKAPDDSDDMMAPNAPTGVVISTGDDEMGGDEMGDEPGSNPMASMKKELGIDELYANAPEEDIKPMSAVTPTGDDMASKGGEAPKVNGGGNPMQTMSEQLMMELTKLYNEVKSR